MHKASPYREAEVDEGSRRLEANNSRGTAVDKKIVQMQHCIGQRKGPFKVVIYYFYLFSPSSKMMIVDILYFMINIFDTAIIVIMNMR